MQFIGGYTKLFGSKIARYIWWLTTMNIFYSPMQHIQLAMHSCSYCMMLLSVQQLLEIKNIAIATSLNQYAYDLAILYTMQLPLYS